MKFNRLALIAACERALKTDREHFDRRQAQLLARLAKDTADWNARYAELWNNAALRIRREIKAGNPITKEMIPNTEGRWLAFFDSNANTHREYQQPRELVALAAILRTVADEVVSITSLERLGISRSVIREASSQLAPAMIAGASD